MFHQDIRVREGAGNYGIHWNIARNLLGFCEVLGCEQGDYLPSSSSSGEGDFLRKDREHVIVILDEVFGARCRSTS